VKPAGVPVTEAGWPVEPWGLRRLLRRLTDDYPVGELAITENGAAYADHRVNGHVADPERTRFYEQHLQAVGDACREGIPLKAYFAWTLLDNFEWAFGYALRFGIVHVDFATQQRTIKDSGRRYGELIRGIGLS
jgi:beta-glucosidase